MILFVHSINEYPAYETSWSQWLLIPQWGELGCSIFFLLSGYGLTIAMQRERNEQDVFILDAVENQRKDIVDLVEFPDAFRTYHYH